MAYERQATEKQIRYILRLAECDRLDQLRNMRTCPLACILSRDEENGRISKARASQVIDALRRMRERGKRLW